MQITFDPNNPTDVRLVMDIINRKTQSTGELRKERVELAKTAPKEKLEKAVDHIKKKKAAKAPAKPAKAEKPVLATEPDVPPPTDADIPPEVQQENTVSPTELEPEPEPEPSIPQNVEDLATYVRELRSKVGSEVWSTEYFPALKKMLAGHGVQRITELAADVVPEVARMIVDFANSKEEN